MKTYLVLAVLAAIGLLILDGCASTDSNEPRAAGPAAKGVAGTSKKVDGKNVGQVMYDADCARCHRLGTYDSAGRAPDLSGQQGEISARFIASHRGLKVTEAEVEALKGFFASN